MFHLLLFGMKTIVILNVESKETLKKNRKCKQREKLLLLQRIKSLSRVGFCQLRLRVGHGKGPDTKGGILRNVRAVFKCWNFCSRGRLGLGGIGFCFRKIVIFLILSLMLKVRVIAWFISITSLWFCYRSIYFEFPPRERKWRKKIWRKNYRNLRGHGFLFLSGI